MDVRLVGPYRREGRPAYYNSGTRYDDHGDEELDDKSFGSDSALTVGLRHKLTESARQTDQVVATEVNLTGRRA
jgi:hypothetical protein